VGGGGGREFGKKNRRRGVGPSRKEFSFLNSLHPPPTPPLYTTATQATRKYSFKTHRYV